MVPPEVEEQPRVTIAIPTHDDEGRIEACLRGALDQDYPRELVDIVVADAMSMDATREIVLRIAESEGRIRLVDNPRRTRAAAFNEVLARCEGEVVVPMTPGDVHARTHVTKCVAALAASAQVAIVPRTSGRTVRERALAAVQTTKLAFAAGAELARTADSGTALLAAVRRSAVLRVGAFDEGATAEEDVDLSRRIARAGGTLAVRRDIVVHRSDAASFRDLFRRHWQLGKSRGRRTARDRSIGALRELGPLAIVGTFGALAATATIQPLTPIAAIAYALTTGAAAVRVGRREGVVTIPIAWAAFPVMHLAQGVGFGAGLARAIVSPGTHHVEAARQ